MTVVRESIAVRGAPAVQVALKFTRHGPVLWEEGARALALRWVGAEPGTAGYLGSLALDRARNWKEFEAAMPRWKVPSENIVYADREGNIGEALNGTCAAARELDGFVAGTRQGRVRMVRVRTE
jgi:penicillin amidase